MSILTKVLIGLVIVAVFPVLYFAAGVLNVQDTWHKKVRELQAKIDVEQKQYELLLNGDLEAQTNPIVPGIPVKGTPGLTQWKTARDNIMRDTSRVWYARPIAESISSETGGLRIELFDDEVNNTNFSLRKPLINHGLADKAFLYVFQMAHTGERGGASDRYIGEFVVSGLPPDAGENKIPLKPASPLTKAEWDTLKATGGQQWVVYDKMPADSRDVFVGLSDNEIKERVPPSTVDEYLNDDRPPSDVVLKNERLKQFVVKDPKTGREKFLRPLRDYERIFQTASEQLAAMGDRLQVLRKEKQFADQAQMNLEKITLPALDARKMRLEQEKALVSAELKVVQGVAEKLTAALTQTRQEISKLVLENKRRMEEAAAGGKLTESDAARPADTAALIEPSLIP